MHWSNLGLIFVAGSQLALGILVFLRNCKNKINISFSLAIIALSFWTFITALFRLSTTAELALIFYQFKLVAGLLIAILFQIFAIFFPFQRGKINFVNQFLIIAPSVLAIFMIIFWPGSAIDRLILNPGQNLIFVNKIFWVLYSLGFTLAFAAAFFKLFMKYKEQSGFSRIQLKYVITGALIPAVFAWFFNIIFLFFGNFIYDWIGAFLTFIFSLVLFYFVFYYQAR